jgi:preprotein translocase subunit SecD
MGDPADRLQRMAPDPRRFPWPAVLGILLLTSFLISGILYWWVLISRVPERGVEFTYQYEWITMRRGGGPPPSPGALLDAVRKRLEAVGPDATMKLEFRGDDLFVRITGIEPRRARDFKRVLAYSGFLELYAVAPVSVQESYNREKVPPAGYRILDNPRERHGAGFEAYGKSLLIEEAPIVNGKNLIHSEARQDLGLVGAQWVTTFELDADGAKLFDEKARLLFNYKPVRGMVAIVLDGQLLSFPVIHSASFGGHGQVSGPRSEEEAKELAIILRSGSLPARLGRRRGGVFIPGEPDVERPLVPPPK